MMLFSSIIKKEEVFDAIRSELKKQNFLIINEDKRPWGGYFVIDEDQADSFIKNFFESLNETEINTGNKLSPKILVVEAKQRLSWQYHHRRAEVWKVIGGKVGIVRSNDDVENAIEIFNTGDLIKLRQGERHRLVGLDDWGIVAEIWQHTDKELPSDEEDIVRITDDYGR